MTSKRKKPETELGTLILKNIAVVMEREREKRNMGKQEFAELCEVTYIFYYNMLKGDANPTLHTISRICEKLKIPIQELMTGRAPL